MAKTTEQKLVFSSPDDAKITQVNVNIASDGKNVEIFIVSEVQTEEQKIENFDEMFPIINPRELIGHKILEYKPKNKRQTWLKDAILEGIKKNLSDFRVPCMDPSEENGKIVFKDGNRPAVGHSPIWWSMTWKEYMPEKNSRSGTDLHWAAFLGKQIKYLVEEKKYSVENAWKAICDDSRDLGHYWNSENAKNDFELTGSRKVGNFYDLANTFKIFEKWGAFGSLFAAGGCYRCDSCNGPLADLITMNEPCNDCDYGVGWLVLDV